MNREVVNKIQLNGENELLLSLESGGKPIYQYIYRKAAGVYWDQTLKSFKTTPIKDWPCSKWYSHIIAVVKSGLDVEVSLSAKTQWENIPERDKAQIIESHAI